VLRRDGWSVATTGLRAYDAGESWGSQPEEAEEIGGGAFIEADLSNPEAPAQVLGAAEETIGPLTALVIVHRSRDRAGSLTLRLPTSTASSASMRAASCCSPSSHGASKARRVLGASLPSRATPSTGRSLTARARPHSNESLSPRPLNSARSESPSTRSTLARPIPGGCRRSCERAGATYAAGPRRSSGGCGRACCVSLLAPRKLDYWTGHHLGWRLERGAGRTPRAHAHRVRRRRRAPTSRLVQCQEWA
jgi:hypothetical protein